MGLYNELRGYYSGQFGSEEKIIENLFKEIEKYIKSSDINGFYPRNIFSENKEVEFYVFFADKIMTLKPNKDKYLITSIMSIKSLMNYKIDRELIYGRIQKVIFEFLNQDTIIFEPREDTNCHWSQLFSEELEMISRSIIHDC